MNKLFSFLAGALSGALVGAVVGLLLTPTSGEDLRQDARNRWDNVLAEARLARETRQAELEAQFNQLKGS